MGQTMASLNTQILRNIDIALPPTKSEQQAIADILSDMDAEISAFYTDCWHGIAESV